jgi:hypothetical protein
MWEAKVTVFILAKLNVARLKYLLTKRGVTGNKTRSAANLLPLPPLNHEDKDIT